MRRLLTIHLRPRREKKRTHGEPHDFFRIRKRDDEKENAQRAPLNIHHATPWKKKKPPHELLLLLLRCKVVSKRSAIADDEILTMVQLIASKDHHQYGEAKRAAARQTRGEPADSDTESFSFFQVLLISSSSSSSFLLAAFQKFGERKKKGWRRPQRVSSH